MFFQKAYSGENETWKWILIPLLAIVGYILGQFPLGAAMIYYTAKNDLSSKYSEAELMEIWSAVDFEVLGIDLNLGLFLALLMFVFMAIALLFFHSIFHKRHWKTLITPFERINWSKIFFSFLLWLGFTIVIESVSYFVAPETYTLNFDFKNFAILVLIVILLMPIQTTTEELLFRGYLLQGFGLLTKNKLTAIIITSVLFSLLHMMNPEVKEFGWEIMFAYYASVGFFLGLITVMDGTLELAIGVHAATNMFSALFMTYEGGALQTYAIFRTEVVNVGLMLPVFFVVASIYFIICWKKYKWEGWRKLLEPIQRPEVIEVEGSKPPIILDS